MPRDSVFVVYVDHAEGNGERLFVLVREHDLEGIVAKHRLSRYTVEDGKPAWAKIRNRRYSQMIGRDLLLDTLAPAANGTRRYSLLNSCMTLMGNSARGGGSPCASSACDGPYR